MEALEFFSFMLLRSLREIFPQFAA